MLDNFFHEKSKNVLSTLVISTILSGTIFMTSSWAMEDEDMQRAIAHRNATGEQGKNSSEEEDSPGSSKSSTSSFEILPNEVVMHVLSFLPLESYDSVSLVCKRFLELANDASSPFNVLFSFERGFTRAARSLLEPESAEKLDIKLYGHSLQRLRSFVRSFENLTPEQKDQILTGYYNELKDKVAKSNNLVDDPRKIWVHLALLRACDKFLTPPMRKWLEEDALPQLSRRWPEETCFSLIDSNSRLREKFNEPLPSGASEDERYLYARELCERDEESMTAVLNEANRHYRNENWEASSDFYSIVLDRDPNAFPQTNVYLKAALASRLSKNHARAGKYFTILLERNPDSEAQIYSMAVRSFLASKDWTTAIKYREIFLEKYPQLAELLQPYTINFAKAYFESKNYELAATCYKKALDEEPNQPTAFYLDAAKAHSEVQNWQQAAAYYKTALDKTPGCPTQMYIAAAEAHSKIEDWQNAAAYYKIALDKFSFLPAKVYLSAAEAHSKIQNWERAATYYKVALSKPGPFTIKDYLAAGNACSKIGDLESKERFYAIVRSTASELAAKKAKGNHDN